MDLILLGCSLIVMLLLFGWQKKRNRYMLKGALLLLAGTLFLFACSEGFVRKRPPQPRLIANGCQIVGTPLSHKIVC